MPDLQKLLGELKTSSNRRKQPTIKGKEHILEAQKDRCFYCGMPFGEWFLHNRVAKTVEIHWDHFVPYCHGFNSNNTNFVAACGQCNHIKSGHVFYDIKELIDYVRNKRKERNLPLRTMWGDLPTQKIMAKVLFADLSDALLLDETGEESPEQIVAECREWRRLRRFLDRKAKALNHEAR